MLRKGTEGIRPQPTHPYIRPPTTLLAHLWAPRARGLKSRPTVGALDLRGVVWRGELRKSRTLHGTKSTDTGPTWPDSEVDPAGNREVPMTRALRPKRTDKSTLGVEIYSVVLFRITK